MADPIVDNKARAAANAEVIQKQKDQDISGKSTGNQEDLGNTISALDSLRDSIVEKKKEDANVDETGAPIKKSDDSLKTPDANPEKPAKVEAAKPDPAPVVPAADDAAATEAARIEAEKKAAEKKAADEFFKDSPSLPANASPKSSEAFSAVKVRAAQEISRLQSELENLTKEAKELKQKTADSLTPEVRQELESLREFRIRMDIETDPKFKEFDKGISAAHEFIYAQLKKSPAVTDEVISEIKKLGGPENVKMDAIFAAVKDPMIQRLVEAKLADVELAKYNKDQAIAANKADVRKYMEDRQKQWEASASAHNTQTRAELDSLINRVGWLNPITPDAKADDAAKAKAEAHNAYATKIREEINMAMSDDSPQMRATLLIGMAQLFRLQAAHEGVTKERDVIKAELEEAKKTVARLSAAGTSRIRESAAPPSSATPAKKEGDMFSERPGDALDRIKNQVAQARAQAA